MFPLIGKLPVFVLATEINVKWMILLLFSLSSVSRTHPSFRRSQTPAHRRCTPPKRPAPTGTSRPGSPGAVCPGEAAHSASARASAASPSMAPHRAHGVTAARRRFRFSTRPCSIIATGNITGSVTRNPTTNSGTTQPFDRRMPFAPPLSLVSRPSLFILHLSSFIFHPSASGNAGCSRINASACRVRLSPGFDARPWRRAARVRQRDHVARVPGVLGPERLPDDLGQRRGRQELHDGQPPDGGSPVRAAESRFPRATTGCTRRFPCGRARGPPPAAFSPGKHRALPPSCRPCAGTAPPRCRNAAGTTKTGCAPPSTRTACLSRVHACPGPGR